MGASLSIAELCQKHENENVHTSEVTRLALLLFDLTEPVHQLTADDRTILEAAAQLHDVGYRVDPAHHRETSAQIVLSEGLNGFHDSQRARIAATMLFHSGDIAATRQHPLVTGLADPDRAARIGAVLRVADGLDYAHLQRTTIINVRCGKRV